MADLAGGQITDRTENSLTAMLPSLRNRIERVDVGSLPPRPLNCTGQSTYLK